MGKKIAVLGLGVGYALACALAEAEYKVIGLDIDPNLIKKPREDSSVKDLKDKFQDQIQNNLILTSNYSDIKDVDTAIVCVSTGTAYRLELGHVSDAIDSCLSILKHGSMILVYSTLPYGSSSRIRKIYEKHDVKIDDEIKYCYMPLMIAQGNTAYDYVNPPFIVFGAYNPSVSDEAKDFYLDFINNSSISKGETIPIFTSTPEVAELTKLAANAFLTTKISFANTIGQLCEKLNVNGNKVLNIIGTDSRIGPSMLKAGYSIGGACFPRDLQSLIETFEENRLPSPLLNGTRDTNRLRLEDPIRVVKNLGISKGSKIAILGISYKAGLSSTTRSMGLDLKGIFEKNGYQVTTFDPNFDGASLDLLKETIKDAKAVVTTINEKIFNNAPNYMDANQVLLDYGNAIADEKGHKCRILKAGQGWNRNDDNN